MILYVFGSMIILIIELHHLQNNETLLCKPQVSVQRNKISNLPTWTQFIVPCSSKIDN